LKVTLGREGLSKSHQQAFPENVRCNHCKAFARIGFVAHEGFADDDSGPYVCDLHDDRWLHDVCAVAVYFCSRCQQSTSLSNQA